jgi:hypothetical protein
LYCEKLTNRENHRKRSAFETSFISKIYFFSCINFIIPIALVGFGVHYLNKSRYLSFKLINIYTINVFLSHFNLNNIIIKYFITRNTDKY